ncbi:MAG: D-3-phosphoglycerate dehydrogenase / 2-oxoglutarate reductase, partial [Chloroflexota bacterium]|nr:D-3-phosphoglycerate dehydrogenase / 2-oxoglutarate reductase [Chloroflexota bacterium]
MTTTSLDKGKIKVLLLEGLDASAIEAFRADGYTSIETHRTALAERELVERIRDAHVLGIRSRTKVPEAALARAEKLVAIGCFCIGTDQVDVEAARDRGVPVFNAPFSNTRSVAELVLGEIIMLCRGVPQRNAAAHRGAWMKSVGGSMEVRGKCLGIVGYGHIGTQIGIL